MSVGPHTKRCRSPSTLWPLSLSYPYSDLMDNFFAGNYMDLGPSARWSSVSDPLAGASEKCVVVRNGAWLCHFGPLFLFSSIAATSYYSRPANFLSVVFGSSLKVCQRQRLRHCRLTSFNRAMTRYKMYDGGHMQNNEIWLSK
jgi:hypothetical protein